MGAEVGSSGSLSVLDPLSSLSLTDNGGSAPRLDIALAGSGSVVASDQASITITGEGNIVRVGAGDNSLAQAGFGTLQAINGGTITLDGQTGPAQLIVGDLASGNGIVSIDGTSGASALTMTGALTSLWVGNAGTGILTVFENATLTTGTTFVGAMPGSFGNVDLFGEEAFMDAGSFLGIGIQQDQLTPGGNGTVIVRFGSHLQADTIVVGPQGILGGDALITGNVTDMSGITSPGQSVGSLTIDGDFTLSSAGTLESEVSGLTGTGDLLSVTGTVTLEQGSTIEVLVDVIAPTDGQMFTLISAANIVDNGFTLVDNNPADLVDYTASIVGGDLIITVSAETANEEFLSGDFRDKGPSSAVRPINPTATYLRNTEDPAALATLAFALADLGLVPGETVALQQLGFFQFGPSAEDFLDGIDFMIGAFSSSDVLLAPDQLNRIEGAIDAGVDIASFETFDEVATDIAEDFEIITTVVQVPANATHLFVAAHDNFYGNNLDPNGDFGVRVDRPFIVGETGQGFLTVNAGQIFSDVSLIMALNPGSQGIGTVTGPGAQLLLSGGLVVGQGGTAELTVTEGFLSADSIQVGVESTADGVLRLLSGSAVASRVMKIGNAGDGTVEVSGFNTNVTVGQIGLVDEALVVGGPNGGLGQLTISDQAVLSTFAVEVGRGASGALNGILTVDNGVLRLTDLLGSFTPPFQDEGGFLRGARNSGDVAEINVQMGGRIEVVSEIGTSGPGVQLARNVGSLANVTVTDPGSSIQILQNGPVVPGSFGPFLALRAGEAHMTIDNDALVIVSGNEAFFVLAQGNSDDFADPADAPILPQSDLQAINGGDLIVSGDGDQATAIIGDQANADGLLRISGQGSTLTIVGGEALTPLGALDVGQGGTGRLEILDSAVGAIQTQFVSLGVDPSGSGSALIDNAIVSFTAETLGVGVQGIGDPADDPDTLTIQNGGFVTVNIVGGGFNIATAGGASGLLTVTDPGTQLNVSGGIFFVGNGFVDPNTGFGMDGVPTTAELRVLNQASLSFSGNGDFVVGDSELTTGTVVVDNASLTTDGLMAIGNDGAADLTISSGATVSNVLARVGATVTSDSLVTVGLAAGDTASWDLIDFLTIGHGDDTQGGTISGTVTVNPGSTLAVGTADNPGAIDVEDGGVLNEATGATIIGTINVVGGTYNMGLSPGIGSVQGDYTMNSGAVVFELAGTDAGTHDRLEVSGTASLEGGVLEFAFIDGYLPSAGDRVEFLTAEGGLSAIEDDLSVALTGLAPGLGFDLTFQPDGALFTALTDGEAGNAVHFVGGAGDDSYAGGDGDDRLEGGAGDDILIGGAGQDHLTGGAGADSFFYQAPGDGTAVGENVAVSVSGASGDTIADFSFAEGDHITLDGESFGVTDVTAANFAVIGTEYDGTNGQSAAFTDGQSAFVLDSHGNLIHDQNGAAEGYTVVANVAEASLSDESIQIA